MPSAVKYRFLRKASPALGRRLISLYSEQGWWTPGEGLRELNRLIRGSHCFVVAESAGEVAGMGRAISDRAGDAYLQDIAVGRAGRGNGIGRGLVAALCARLRKDGIGWIGLIAQDGSAGFYGRLGFKVLPNAAPMLVKGARV